MLYNMTTYFRRLQGSNNPPNARNRDGPDKRQTKALEMGMDLEMGVANNMTTSFHPL